MKKLLFAVVLCLLVLAACEGLARLGFRLAMGRPYDAGELRQRLAALTDRQSAAKATERGASGRVHPYFGFITANDAPLPARRDFADATSGQFGFDGDVPLFDPSGATFLVMVTGGSVAHHFAVDRGRELLAFLEKRPEFAGRTGRLLNTALPGYKQPQQLLILSYLLGLGLRPDVVLNLDGFNEACIAVKNLESGIDPFMPWFWIGNDTPSRARLRLLGRLEFVEGLRDRVAAFLSRLPALPALVGFPAAALDRLADGRVKALEGELVRDALAGAGPLASQRTSPGGGFSLGPNLVLTKDRFYELAAASWARASILMHDMIRDAGGRYFHALQPAEPLWAAARGQAAGPLCTEDCVEAGYPSLIRYGQALSAAGLRYGDLVPALDGASDVFTDCCHMTPAGQDALLAALTRLIDKTWNAPAPAVDPTTALAALADAPAPPFAGADLLAAAEPTSVAVEHLRGVERSSEGPYRTVLGREAVVCLPLGAPRKLRLAFGLKNPLPGQALTVSLNGRELGRYALEKPDGRLDQALEADFVPGLNTLSFAFARANEGPDRNKDMPEGYAAQFTALSLSPAPDGEKRP